ncbi:asparagine synthase (glutamine-hydrolyzing) [Kutzneria viridogrisea]|uniref:asparagine synthase (glutamine-hydrolyzing) n=1 Tax=Kutzneria viridogrisea TaxID=47990 RepID=A0ABR6BAS5_9PSEU|nr:asparagine synthase (glutamine-hydrolyzing) [Kutzneria viridogrisea]
MCGIVGWVDFARDLTNEVATLNAMTATMACRGPDDSGTHRERHALLGHRRLAVIDLAGGHQPMTAEAGGHQVALTFSGEVYNYVELRAELRASGYRFRTHSDTEVVLAAYLRWGADFATRLNGMYALGLWDGRTETLLLVRDRMGVKPLYYFRTPHGVLFGSEPKAILANPMVPRRVDAAGLCEVLDMVKTPGAAVFSGMAEVIPGQMVRFDRNGSRSWRYWRLTAEPHTEDWPTTVSTVRELLRDTVTRQLVADVEICTLLSGGLDSSVVTALSAAALAEQGTGPVRSFSVDFTSAATGFEPDAVRAQQDAPFARELAAHVGARHNEVLLDSADLAAPDTRAAVLRATDTPPAYWGDMWPSLYLLFRAVRQHSTVALSGEAADELFGGYRWFHNPRAVGASTFPWLTPGSERYFGGLSLLDPGLIGKLDIPGYRAERYQEAVAEVPVLAGESLPERRMREISYLNLTRFVQTLLDRKDRMSMANGLEVRVPFCDHRLVQYVFNVPWQMKNRGGVKGLLRAAAESLVPQSVLDRKKTPYPATQDPGYATALRSALAAILDDLNAPVRPLLNLARAEQAVRRDSGRVSLPYDRGGLELAIWLNDWLAGYDLALDL